MKKQEKNKQLIQLIQETKSKVEDYKETLPAGETKDAGDLVNVLNSALYRLGFTKPKQNSTAPKNAFEKKGLKESGSIKNKPPQNAFKRKAIEDIPEPKINNKAPKDAFKKKEFDLEEIQKEEAIKRTGNKWNKRLNKNKKAAIKELFDKGYSIEEISEELWIDEKAIAKNLGIKAPSVLIADNTTSQADEFVQQVKESKA